MVVMIITLILCLIGNYVCFYLAAKNYKKNNKSGIFFLLGIVLSVVSAALLVNIIDENTRSAAVGNYDYYINGKKVSSSTFAATNNWLWGLLSAGIFIGSGFVLSTFVIKKHKGIDGNKQDKIDIDDNKETKE